MAAPQPVLDLIETFERNRQFYTSPEYNEAQLRREFLDPCFKSLGWDVDNTQGHAPAYRDVIHEDSIKIGGFTKAPDYCFRIGGARKFFVEAKKPAVDVKGDISPAFQLRRYAWSNKLPLSILTDFEEFAVYDCRIRPAKTDKPSTARILYMTCDEYAERWDEIADVFSREAVLKGSFDKYAETTKGRRGTAEVDVAFLKEIEAWRELLAKNLALRNPGLSTRDLNFAVQTTIDRIVFLRICEDRGIENYGQLLALTNGGRVYERLFEHFRAADTRYDSGLFHFSDERGQSEEPDRLTPGLKIDDKALNQIIKSLYYPDSPYEFSVLPADILGQTYEQFLGKVIRLTAGHRAVIEDKPEVKKAGGVYYTPTYIVDYIVKNTVGKLVEGKKPAQVAKLKILDPACGSGSFLIGAYQHLLDWHRNFYVDDGAAKHHKKGVLYEAAGGEWRLTTAEKKRILVNNIFGVDIDPQAVEVTKLSLLLKVLENETQLSFLRERALPDLGNNIKCGNSLIGTDFYEGKQMAMFDEEERYRINPFDWDVEFAEIMKAGGFDAVIGNPPYVRMESFKELKEYLRTNYACHDERSDLYAYFVERAHRVLKKTGRFGMIVSNKFLRSNYGRPLRSFLAAGADIEEVVDFAGLPVFPRATVRTVVLLTSRNGTTSGASRYVPPLSKERFESVAAGRIHVGEATQGAGYKIPRTALGAEAWSFMRPEAGALVRRLQEAGVPLGVQAAGLICMGIKSGLSGAFVIDDSTARSILDANPEAREIVKPFLNGRDVRRYHIEPKRLHLIYSYHGVDMQRYPAVEQHLRPFKDRLLRRVTRQEWYELQQPQFRFAAYMERPKIIFPDIATAPRFALDEVGFYSSNTTYFIARADKFLLGLLNSRLGSFYFQQECAGLEGKNEVYLRFFGQYLESFPIRIIDFSSPGEKAKHDRMLELVEHIIELHKQLQSAKTNQDKTVLQRQIDATDREIDQLVYELYDLTDDEIKIVEEATAK